MTNFHLRSPTRSPRKKPATIDEESSMRDSALRLSTHLPSMTTNNDLSDCFRRSTATTTHDDLQIRTVMFWKIKMGPIKKHIVSGHLVPTIGSTVAFLNQKTRRISIEHRSPLVTEASKKQKSKTGLLEHLGKHSAANTSTSTVEGDDKEEDMLLGNEDTVYLKVFKKRKKGRNYTSGSASEDDDDDDTSLAGQSVASAMSASVADSDMHSVLNDPSSDWAAWKAHRQYRFELIDIVKTIGKTVEVKAGAGNDVTVRDYKFESEADAVLFRQLVDFIRRLEQDRTQRQISLYREAATSTTAATADGKKQDVPLVDNDNLVKLLVEIVSAKDIPVADLFSTDAYVLVYMSGKQVHKTAVISKSLNPIWTIETGSLFLLKMTPEEFFSSAGGMTFVLKDFDALGKDDKLGSVVVPLDEVLNGTGERVGYPITQDKHLNDEKKEHGTLYLRFRHASKEDVDFMETFQENKNKVGVYANETYLPIKSPSSKFLKRQEKKGLRMERLHRVRPYPDPDREDDTSWLSSEQLEVECMKPSTNWVEAGSGDVGKVFVEILRADDLPNMDKLTLNVMDKTDAFCCLVYGDSIVNTDVIGNTLQPKWMPWCNRAFVFNMSHPSLDLFIGVFDHDPETAPLQLVAHAASASSHHSPIGRIDINLSAFVADTLYTAAYPLYLGENADQRQHSRGKLWVRFRMQYYEPKKAFLSAIVPPPETYVSVARNIDFDVAHYVTDGMCDETEFSMDVLARYVEELQSYQDLIFYIQEAFMVVWLWRGHYPFKYGDETYMLPVHSMTAFLWGIIVTNNYNTYPSFFLFSIGWFMLACNEYISQAPSPWHRAKNFVRAITFYFMSGTFFTENIPPNLNVEEQKAFEERRKKKFDDWKRERELEAERELEVRKELGVDTAVDEDITSHKKGVLKGLNVNPLKPILYPIQIQLHDIAIYLRIAKSIIMWDDSFYSFWIVALSFLGSFLIIWIPFGFVLRWLIRILVWVGLGPWMMLVDQYYFKMDPNLSKDERNKLLQERFKARYDQLAALAANADIKKERSVKLKSMNRYMFGKFLLRVPRFNEDVFKDTPLPESFAEPFDAKRAPPVIVKERKYGQRLVGDMIPIRSIQEENLTKSEKKSNFRNIRKGLSKKTFSKREGEHKPLLESRDKPNIPANNVVMKTEI